MAHWADSTTGKARTATHRRMAYPIGPLCMPATVPSERAHHERNWGQAQELVQAPGLILNFFLDVD